MVILPAGLLLLVVTPGAASMAIETEEMPPAVERSIRLLRDSRLPDSMSSSDVVRALRADVNAAHPALVDLLVAGRVPALAEEESPQTLSVPQREMVLEAFSFLPGGALNAQADRLLAAEEDEIPDVAARLTAMHLLALGGGSDSLVQLFKIATPEPGSSPERCYVDALEWSIEAILATEGRAAHGVLRLNLSSVPEPLVSAVLRALGDDGDPAGMALVLPIAERYSNLRLLAFAQARRLGSSGDPDLDQWFAMLLRRHLDPEEPKMARAAALVLGELSDTECVEDLIELLEDTPASAEAYWALCRISGLRIAPNRDRWRRWHQREVAFFRDSYEDCLIDLHGSHDGLAVAAIRELSKHKLQRHEVAEELVYALEQAPPMRRRLLCNALQAVGSEPSAPALVHFLNDPDPVVVASALRALHSLTDYDLTAEPEAWTAVLPQS